MKTCFHYFHRSYWTHACSRHSNKTFRLIASLMTSVGCSHMLRQRNKDFVQNHDITHSKKRENYIKNTFYAYFSWIFSYPWVAGHFLFVSSCFSRKDASSDTHDDPNGPVLQFDPDYGQGHRIIMDFIMCGVAPPNWAMLPECYQFSENLVYIVAYKKNRKSDKTKCLSTTYDDHNKRHFWVLLGPLTFSVALSAAIKRMVRHPKVKMTYF